MRNLRLSVTTGGVAALLLAIVVAGTVPAASAPGTPGVAQQGTVVFHEDFQNGATDGPRTMLVDYVGAGGQAYSADPYWNDARMANGFVMSFDDTKLAGDGTGAGNGTEQTAFNTLRQLAQAIGKVNGSAVPKDNQAISAYTQSTGAAPAGGQAMARTTSDIVLDTDAAGRYLTFAMTAAAANCRNAAHPTRENPQYVLDVVKDGVETTLTTTPIDPCAAAVVTVDTSISGTTEPVHAGRFVGDTAVKYQGGSFGMVVRNLTSAHMGNDGAWDDLQILDVTPQLDKAFSPAVAETGTPVRLTFTVTNTADLLAKDGWSFTDTLPEGMVVADDPRITVDGTATVTAEPGSATIDVAGGLLARGQASVTIAVDVVVAHAGTFTNDASNITGHAYLDLPGTTGVTFADKARVSVSKALGGARVGADDQFSVQVRAGSASGTVLSSPEASTTGGSGSEVVAGTGTTGATVVDAGTAVVVTESGSPGTDLAAYDATVTCTDTAGVQQGLPSDVPLGGGLTITPVRGADIACVITNTPRQDVDLKVDKRFVTTTGWYPGDTVTFEVQVMNAGTSTATGVQVIDTVLNGLDASSLTWDVPQGTADGATWDVGDVAPSQVLTAQVAARIAPGMDPAHALRNSVTVQSPAAGQGAPALEDIVANETVGEDGDRGDYEDVPVPTTTVLVAKVVAARDGTWVSMSGSTWAVWTDATGTPGDDADGVTIAPVDGQTGVVQITGLRPGTYWLAETTAPAGFSLLATPVRFVVGPDLSVTVDPDQVDAGVVEASVGDEGVPRITVRDVPTFRLPETGGPGTAWSTVVGGLALAVAAGLTGRARRRAALS